MKRTLERETVAQVMAHDPAAVSGVLRSYRIDPTNRMSLAVAAAAASTTTDELLAVIETRMRRAARRLREVEIHEEEYELAY